MVYVHTRSDMHAVFMCFRNPPNYDTDTGLSPFFLNHVFIWLIYLLCDVLV